MRRSATYVDKIFRGAKPADVPVEPAAGAGAGGSGDRAMDKVGRTYIVKLVSGDKRNPSLVTLQRLAKTLRVPVTELLG